MAATVVFDGTRIADGENLTPSTPVPGEWDDTGGQGRCVLDPDTKYQASNGVTYKVKTSEIGVNFIPDTATYDITSGPKVFLYKGVCIVAGALGTTRATGLKFEMGSGASVGSGQPSQYYHWYIATNGTYPPTTNWLLLPIDANQVAWIDSTTGTVSKTAINYWGVIATLTVTTVKTENTGQDAIDYVNAGAGLTLTGTDGTFQDFIDFDEGTVANRYGVVHVKEGVLFVNGVLTIGTSTATTFSDSFKDIVFPAGFVGEGFFGLDYGMSNASQDIDLTGVKMKSLGIAKKKGFFDTALEVNATTDVITLPATAEFETGDYILYSREGGSFNMGLTDAGNYWVRAETSTTFSFHASRNAAMTTGLGIALTVDSAPGENHSIVRVLDTRADHDTTSTTGVGLEWIACTWQGVRQMTLTSIGVITGGFLIRAGNVTASTASITSLNVSNQTTAEGDALFTPLTTLNNITECVIASGDDGHFAELTSTGTFTSNNTYTGFWNPDVDGWKFHTQTGVDHTTEVITTDANHGFSDGDAIYYNDEGGTDTIGLTDLAKYYAGNTTADTLSIHATKAAAVAGTSKIDLSDGSGGETHSLYSANATIFNDSGGSVTINVTTGSSTPSVRNGSGTSTTVDVSVTITVTVLDKNSDPIENVQTAIYKTSDRTELMNEDTTALGVATEDYPGSTPVQVEVICRKASPGATKYKNYSSIQTISASGLVMTATMFVDPNNNS